MTTGLRVLADVDRTLRERSAGMSALEALREWLASGGRDDAGDLDDARLEARLRREAPAVAACDLRHQRQFERRLAEAVADDFGEPADSLREGGLAALRS